MSEAHSIRPAAATASGAGLAATGPAGGTLWSRMALLAAVGAILLATLSPAQWTQTEGRPAGLDARLADVLLNLVLFAPLGGALGACGRSRRVTLLIGVLLSASVEFAQLWIPGRVGEVSDVAMNSLGTLVGWMVWTHRASWSRPVPRVAGRLAAGVAVAAGLTIGVTGLLLEPAFPATPYFGHRPPEFTHLRVYPGRVLEASIGGATIASGPLADSPGLRTRLLAGEPLRVVAEGAAPRAGLAPIVSVNDQEQEIVMLGVDGQDLVYRFRTRAAGLGLDNPEIRIRGALRNVQDRGRLAVTVTRQPHGYCVDVNGSATCDVGFTAGMGWALLAYGQGMPSWSYGALGVSWLAALALPAGYWAPGRALVALAVALLGAGVLVVPELSGLAPTPAGELAGVLAGFVAGAWLRRFRLGETAVTKGSGR